MIPIPELIGIIMMDHGDPDDPVPGLGASGGDAIIIMILNALTWTA
jgi:hypothetical protein